MENTASLRKNPSREACEEIIHKILTTEVIQLGENKNFKQASDFMSYFESLYPASESLTKQVQRAVKSMNMPKDEMGCFIINKTSEQIRQDGNLKDMLSKTDRNPIPLSSASPVFLSVEAPMRTYLQHLLSSSITFQNSIITIVESSNGLILYTDNLDVLCKLLNNFIDDK